jgi:hypothetical protein
MGSKMNWGAYFRAVIAVAVLRAADLYITFVYTPDLASEWNPLVSFFGLTWYGFVVTQILICAFIAAMMFFYFNRTPPEINLDGLSLNDFSYVYFFGKLHPWPRRLFTLPQHPRRHLALNGYIFMVAAIGISIFAIVNNALLISENATYTAFVQEYHSSFFPLTFALMIIIAFYAFFHKEFEYYKKNRMINDLQVANADY